MSAQDLFSRFSVESFRTELDSISDKLNDVTVSNLKNHSCVDCGVHLAKFNAVRCRKCNLKHMRESRRKKK